MRRLLVIALQLGCSACDSGPPKGAITLVPTQYDASSISQTELGDLLDLVRPPQGGFVAFVGARAEGLGEDMVEMHARLRDRFGSMVAEDVRMVSLLADPGDPKIAIPDLQSYLNVANLTLCPTASTTDRNGEKLTLEMTITEVQSRRSGSGAQVTTLTCRQTDPAELRLCQCECEGNYFLGKCAT